MKNLDSILSFLYNNRNDINIDIKHDIKNINIISIDIMSIISGARCIHGSIYFNDLTKRIEYYKSGTDSLHVLINDAELFDKWYPIFNKYCNEKGSKIIIESIEKTLSTKYKSLYRDYKINKIIDNKCEKPE